MLNFSSERRFEKKKTRSNSKKKKGKKSKSIKHCPNFKKPEMWFSLKKKRNFTGKTVKYIDFGTENMSCSSAFLVNIQQENLCTSKHRM